MSITATNLISELRFFNGYKPLVEKCARGFSYVEFFCDIIRKRILIYYETLCVHLQYYEYF